MKVIVDTSVWSLALRRSAPENNPYVHKLKELIKETRAQIIGPIRQDSALYRVTQSNNPPA
ncbi:MAG: hypothetical protein D3916_02395 [Candidatus Electrothrix sp. MAN1_4]|nr:hypothetical protein [Candidatus Electrothrix sp. MAN1_4]